MNDEEEVVPDFVVVVNVVLICHVLVLKLATLQTYVGTERRGYVVGIERRGYVVGIERRGSWGWYVSPIVH